MYCINLESTDPYLNLAVDEYLLKNGREDFLTLAINDKSVIIGKHQVAHREAATRFVVENNIPVIRRISGGGTVFHDKGNLNFSFILNSQHGKQVDFKKYTQPVISFLSSLGIDAKYEGKNDLKVEGQKISGNAEHIYRNRVLHHGTLLFDADLELLKNSIREETGRYITRAVASNPSPVLNLNNVLKNVFKYVDKYVDDIYEFRSIMLRWFLENMPGTEKGVLTEQDIMGAESLADSKYRTWEWNYSYGPDYHFNNNFNFLGVEYFCSLFVRDGIIWECKIKGSEELEAEGKKLIGCRHMVEDIRKILENENWISSGFDVYNFF